MKNFNNLLAAFFILTSDVCFGQYPDYKTEALILQKNSIKEQTTYQYPVNNGSLTGDSILTERKLYDRQGNILESYVYDKQGNVSFKWLLEYNEKGHMIKQTGYEKDRLSTTLLYEYDDKGNLRQNRQLSSTGELYTHQKREYNQKNLNTKLYNQDDNGHFFLAKKYFYDKAGNQVRSEDYNEQGFLVFRSFSEYDKISNTWKYYGGQGKQRKLISYSIYNTENQIIEITITGEVPFTLPDGRVINQQNQRTTKSKYNTNSTLIEQSLYNNLIMTESSKYYYQTF